MTIADLRLRLLWGLLALSTGCATPVPDPDTRLGTPVAQMRGEPTEGLERVPLDGPEVLYLRPGWPIGGYDALMFAPVELTFEAGTRARGDERERLESLVVEKARAEIVDAGLSVHDRPGPCTLLSQSSVLDIELHTPSGRTGSAVSYVSSWGRARIEFNLFDSQTGTPLVHFVSHRRIPGSIHGSGRDWSQIERTMDALLADTQLAMRTALQTTRMSPSRPNCRGGIYRAFRALEAANE